MKLGPKLRVSYVGLVLVAVFIVLALIIEDAQRELKEKIGRDLQYVAELAAKDIDAYIGGREAMIREFSKAYAVKTGDAQMISAYLDQEVRAASGFKDLSVVNLDGKVIASTDPEYEGKPVSYLAKGSEDILERAKKEKRDTVLVKFVYGKKNELGIHLFTPVADSSGRNTLSILAGSVKMDDLLQKVGQFRRLTVRGEKAYLLDNPSKMIVTQNGEAQTFSPLIYLQADSSLRPEMKGKKSGYSVYRDSSGVKVIAGYADMAEYGTDIMAGWSVISQAPQEKAFSPAIRLRDKMITLGIIAVIIAWIIAFFVARGISRPIRKLVRVTGLIARGDLSQRANIDLDDEVGDLARSFNKMADKLNAAIATRDQEIIERKNVEEKLKEKMEEKTKLISMISDEFRTPLTAIRECLNRVLGKEQKEFDEQQKSLLGLAKRSGENLSRLVSDIVEIHKLKTEKADFMMGKNDINEVIKTVRTNMVPLLAGKKDVKFNVALEDQLPEAVFDKEKITLVLTNIVNLAINSTKRGEVEVVSSREGENAIRVDVKGSAISIDKEKLPELFRQFDEYGQKRDKESGGTGLGLAISKNIIEKHRGKIWAEAGGAGEITFHVVLPCEERRKQQGK
ncbi:MAG: sensor histidine kinase [Candidatus Omnitrophota bacterium]